jgi:hypothetical protein
MSGASLTPGRLGYSRALSPIKRRPDELPASSYGLELSKMTTSSDHPPMANVGHDRP